MSVEATHAVWTQSESRGVCRLVLLALADYADDELRAWPSVKTLKDKCRISERACQNALRSLEQAGEISIAYGAGLHGVNVYKLALGRGAADAPPVQDVHPAESAPVQTSAPDPSLTAKGLTSQHKNNTQEITGEVISCGRGTAAAPRRRSPRRAKPPPDPRVRELVVWLQERQGYPVDAWAKEAAGAKWMLDHGYSPEQIHRTYLGMRAEPWWEGKHVGFQNVKARIGEAVKHGHVARAMRF